MHPNRASLESPTRGGPPSAFVGGAWALGDQAVLSLGNFLTSLALLRTLAPADYGVYALTFGTLLFLLSLHAALVAYPLSVGAASAAGAAVRRFTGHAVLLTLGLWVPLAAGVVLAVWLLRRPDLAGWAAAALLAWLVQETLRRALLARFRHRDALVGDAVSYLGQAACVWLLARRGMLTPGSALAAMTLTSAAGAAIQALQLRPRVSSPVARLAPVGRRFLAQGRWLLLVNLMGFFTVQAVPWALKFFHGEAAVAQLQAMAVLLGVGHPVTACVVGLIVPAAAAHATRAGTGAARHAAAGYALAGAVLLAPYYAVLCVAPAAALSLVSGGESVYLSLSTPLRLLVAAYAFHYVAQVSAALLNGLGESRRAFLAHAAAAIATIAAALPLAAAYGLAGAVAGGLAAACVHALVSLRVLRERETPTRNMRGRGNARAAAAAEPVAPAAVASAN